MDVTVSPTDPALWFVARNVAARLLDQSPGVEPAVAAEAGRRSTGEDFPGRPTPFTLRLHAAATEAPATSPAIIAARKGER